MKKRVLLRIPMLILLLVMTASLLLIGCGRRKGTSDTNVPTEDIQNDGIQGTQDEDSKTDWESGVLEEQDGEQNTQKNPSSEKEEDAQKNPSSEKEEDAQKNPSSEKEEDAQDSNDDATPPQPNTETGWGPIT